MRSRCLARAINRSLLTEFAAVRGFKVRNFISGRGGRFFASDPACVIRKARLHECAFTFRKNEMLSAALLGVHALACFSISE